MREKKGSEGSFVYRLLSTGSRLQQRVERRNSQTQGRLHHGPDSRTSSSPKESRLRLRAHPCHGATIGSLPPRGRKGPPPERRQGRQPSGESRTVGWSSAGRDSGL